MHTFHAAKIEVGQHWQTNVLGLTLNLDTIIGTAFAAAVVIGLGLLVRAKITAGVPNGVQLSFETMVKLVREQVDNFIGVRVAPFLVPVGLAVFIFILACNWIAGLPLHHFNFTPPTSDINLEYALVGLLFIWWHASGFRKHKVRYPGKVAKGHFAPFAPMWIIETVTHPVSLALRLFGNMLGGGIMVSVIALLPAAISWLPMGGWKIFDMAIGVLQAYVFMLLMIYYFSMAMESEEAH